jgi:hypothetical protein
MFGTPAPSLRAFNVSTLGDRVAILRKLVWKGQAAIDPRLPPVGSLADPMMRRIGLLTTRACPARDDLCELGAIFDFITKNVRYTGDIAYKDTFQSALRTLQMHGGDCDDHATLGAVLAMENGFFTKFRITSNHGPTWDHIYLMAGLPKHSPKRWIALDTTLGRGRFGREPPRAKYKDFEVGEL